MNPLNWSWSGLLLATLAYWLLAIAAWIALRRRNARSAEPSSMRQVSETEVMLTFEEEIRLIPLAAVLFGPPLGLLALWLLVGR